MVSTDGRTDTERYNIIPRHTLVAGYKNPKKGWKWGKEGQGLTLPLAIVAIYYVQLTKSGYNYKQFVKSTL